MHNRIKSHNSKDEKYAFEQKLYLFLFLFLKDLDTKIFESKLYKSYIDRLSQKTESTEGKRIKIDDLESAGKDIENRKKHQKKFLFF